MTRLGILSHKLFYRTTDTVQTTGGFPILVDALAAHFDAVLLAVPVLDRADFQGSACQADNIDWLPLPPVNTPLQIARHQRQLRSQLNQLFKTTDVLMLMLPSYVGILGSFLAQRQQRVVTQLVMGDWGQNFVVRRRHRLTRQLTRRLVKPFIDAILRYLTRDVLTFFDGHILYGHQQAWHRIFVSSSIHTGDLYLREENQAPGPPYKVLYVGRLSAEKGVTYAIDAVGQLRDQSFPLELHIVGTGPVEASLKAQVKNAALENRVIFHGFVPHGPRLQMHYRQSDLFVLPSLQDQQPKVLLEAMANSLPIVATSAGGIPRAIRHEQTGLLVPPADGKALAEALARILQDIALWQHVQKNGFAHAQSHTVEQEIATIVHTMRQHFATTHGKQFFNG